MLRHPETRRPAEQEEAGWVKPERGGSSWCGVRRYIYEMDEDGTEIVQIKRRLKNSGNDEAFKKKY